MNAAENQAVFLSYASQDAAAVSRICEALRAAGVEVWFDQSELPPSPFGYGATSVGGDAWDAEIRGQIGSCALFVPVISASTEVPREGPCRTVSPSSIVRFSDGSPLVQSNQTRPPSHNRALLRRSRGRGSEGMEAYDATATPRRDGTLAADEPSEL